MAKALGTLKAEDFLALPLRRAEFLDGDPRDTAEEVEERLWDYLQAGVQEVWLVYPRARRVGVWTPGGMGRVLGKGGVLASPVLPGFSCPVAEVFPEG